MCRWSPGCPCPCSGLRTIGGFCIIPSTFVSLEKGGRDYVKTQDCYHTFKTIREMTTRTTEWNLITLLNVFYVKPENQEKLLKILNEAAEELSEMFDANTYNVVWQSSN